MQPLLWWFSEKSARVAKNSRKTHEQEGGSDSITTKVVVKAPFFSLMTTKKTQNLFS